MRYLGIDPGWGGGIASIDVFNGGCVAAASKMPSTERDIYDLISELASDADHAVIERVHSMPDQGVASSFKFGHNYGFVRGCLVACLVPFTEVTPRRWMRGLGIRTRGKKETPTEWKNHLKSKAQQLFPQERVTLATADALLIAEYCRREFCTAEKLF